MNKADWCELAAKTAEKIFQDHFEQHVGALRFPLNVVAIFGNDGYSQDEKTRQEVETVRNMLPSLQAKELGFGTTTTMSTTTRPGTTSTCPSSPRVNPIRSVPCLRPK
jgi:hypothetical protein